MKPQTLHELRAYLAEHQEKLAKQCENGIIRSQDDLVTLLWKNNPELDLSYKLISYEVHQIDTNFNYVIK